MGIKSFHEWLTGRKFAGGLLGLAAQDADQHPDVYSRLVLLRAIYPGFHRTPLGLAYARARRSYKAYVARRVRAEGAQL